MVFNILNGDVATLVTDIGIANTNNQPDTFNLATNGTYTISAANNGTFGGNGLPVLLLDTASALNTVTFNGNGATITRSGAASFRFFQLGQSGFNGPPVTFNNLTLSNGDPNAPGGAIAVLGGTATLSELHSLRKYGSEWQCVWWGHRRQKPVRYGPAEPVQLNPQRQQGILWRSDLRLLRHVREHQRLHSLKQYGQQIRRCDLQRSNAQHRHQHGDRKHVLWTKGRRWHTRIQRIRHLLQHDLQHQHCEIYIEYCLRRRST